MISFGADTLATLEFRLTWRDANATFEERYLARRVNTWRDIFPPGLDKALEGTKPGDRVTLDYTPEQLFGRRDPAKVLTMSRKRFRRPRAAGRDILVAPGRFYPQGLLLGLANVYPSTTTPFRLIELGDDHIVADTNHPLAGRKITVEVIVRHVEEKRSDTGGTLYHWMEEIGSFGPGMQAALKDTPLITDNRFFSRLDEREDAAFYDDPRLISHIDKQASENLSKFYGTFLKPGMKVLDLMTSVDSHLPEGLELDVTGLGMSLTEMAENPALGNAVVHDLNVDPVLPAAVTEQGSFDAVLCSLSIEYLIDPVNVLENVRESLTEDGVLLVGFSDRWFPTKAVSGWMDLHPFERPGMVLQWMRDAGFGGEGGGFSMRNDWRPREDIHFMETRGVSDPVFMTWARKS